MSSRPRTAATVAWAPPAWTTAGANGADQRTPDLAPVLQEIVSRSGWASGNSSAFIVTGSGSRAAETYNGGKAEAALLHIEYTTG